MYLIPANTRVIVLQAIVATFEELILEQSTTCDFDSVSLYDGSSDRSLMLGKYCTAAPDTITTFSSYLFVVFESDYSNKDGRFLLTWSFVSRNDQGLTCNE